MMQGMTVSETLHRTALRPHWSIALLVSQLLVALLWWRCHWQYGLPALLLSHALFIVPIFLPRSRLYAPLVARLRGTAPQLWLTIDDGPSDDTLAILELLDRHAARATFFLVGERAAQRPQLVQEIVRRGHGIGNHSHRHPQAWFWALGPRRMRAEITQAQQVLQSLSGQPPRWYRSVVGMTNPFVAAPLRCHRLTRVAWSARGYDAVDGDVERSVRRISSGLRPGAIVLLHEGAAHGRNLQIVQRVLEEVSARGLRAVLPEPPLAAPGRPA
jgi:peptidoglycan/xylan/chitin deacetylase (PgdA/CDA1 family)